MLKKEPPSKNRNKNAWCGKGLETVCSHQLLGLIIHEVLDRVREGCYLSDREYLALD